MSLLQAKSIHKTVKNSQYVECALAGNWMPPVHTSVEVSIEEILFNMRSYFLIQQCVHMKYSVDPTHCFSQQMFTKIHTICKGPNIFEFDSFFAALSNQIILYTYSNEEKLIVKKLSIHLDPLLIEPSKIYYENSLLIVSCDHGGLGLYFIDEQLIRSPIEGKLPYKLQNVQKSRGLAPITIRQTDGRIGRFEAGFYNVYDPYQGLITVNQTNLNIEGTKIAMAVPYDGGIIFFLQVKMHWYLKNNEFSPISSLDQADGIICDWCQLNNYTIAFLTDKSKLYILEPNNQFREMPFVNNQKMTPIINFTKIINYKMNVILAVNDSGESYICALKNEGFQLFPTRFYIGRKNLVISRTKNKILQMISNHNKCVTISRPGPRVYSRGIPHPTFTSPITKMYSQSINKTDTMIVFSTSNQTHIMRIQYASNAQPATKEISLHYQNGAPYMGLNGPCLGFGSLFIDDKLQFLLAMPDKVVRFNENSECYENKVMCSMLVTDPYYRKYMINVAPEQSSLLYYWKDFSNPSKLDYQTKIVSVSFSSHFNRGSQFGDLSPRFFLVVCEQKLYLYRTMIDDVFDSTCCKESEIKNLKPTCGIWIDEQTFAIGYEHGVVQIYRALILDGKPATSLVTNISVGDSSVLLYQYADAYPTILSFSSKMCLISVKNNGILMIRPISATKIPHFLTPLTRYAIFSPDSNEVDLMMVDFNDCVITVSPVRDDSTTIINTEPIPSMNDETNSMDLAVTTQSGIYIYTNYDIPHADAINRLTVSKDETILSSKLDKHMIAWLSMNISKEIIVHVANLSQQKEGFEYVKCKYNRNLSLITLRESKTVDTYIPGIVCAGGTIVVLFQFNTNKTALAPVSRLENVGTKITAIAFHTDKLIVGDQNMGIKLFKYDDTSRCFTPISSMGQNMRQCITAISVCPSEDIITVGDRSGNFMFFSDALNKRPFDNIAFESCFNVGDPIVGAYTTLYQTMSHSQNQNQMQMQNQAPKQSHPTAYMWYSTITGEVGVFMSHIFNPNNPYLNILLGVELKVSEMLTKLTGINPLEKRNKQYPSSAVIDLDIVEMFADMPLQFQEDFARNLTEKYKMKFDRSSIIDLITRYLVYCLHYPNDGQHNGLR
ncbi:hypothetical protein TVAG_408360 [Trichomonas vaginalis G3]|uniref:DNA damage-binding protein 1 n=1 Tax=Trichomonas vaginalis (strain ATCC PRA-98 / G3) TaxID=412133 RepID=A2F6N7_TRIV3|nr:DNA repair/RNA processing CPSF family [Trichomonas vaginalis G3]EAX99426.1 hypothetical protein TVAG_408360 [Trichomonas vaginalis G3]KAI5516139.1 DNA repair/RNA processing CPSF family [Trichomonas vaginalis G3]|eukprot:XP_001312356.1 hypothetical protein [Trichomonas vaginalis G3]